MSNLLAADIIDVLQPRFGTTLIITAGNTFRCDDGVGPHLAQALSSLQKAYVIDAGHTPENIVDEAIALKPKNIIILDAADFGGIPGEVRIIPDEMIPETTLSTHMIPLNVVSKLIINETQARVTFIGIQPKNVSMGEGLCDEVKQSADMLIETIKKAFS